MRPFDPAAAGGALGEGGGILVLEARQTAQRRPRNSGNSGGAIYAELIGFAATQAFCADTVGLEIEADGDSIADAIEAALDAARIHPGEVDAIAPLGSGIPHIDRAEAAAITRVFGSRAAEIPLITTIPYVGNCCAGASAIPIIIAAMALKTQMLPARLNTQNAAGLNANAAPSRPAALRHILVVTTGMGGQNAALVLRRSS